jgi:hypothetical protein
MEIEKFNYNNLRNGEHNQFQTEIKELIEKYTPEALGIAPLYATYLPLYNNECEALNVITKNDKSELLANADIERDTTVDGFSEFIKSLLKHYDPEVRQAATRIKIVIDSAGNVAAKPYDDETSSINKLCTTLTTNYANDIAAIPGASGWLSKLKADNDAFETIMNERYTEESAKTQLRMKQVRVKVDAAYSAIIKRVNALIEVNGEANYAEFATEVNQRIYKYSNQLAQRKGRNAKDNKKEEDTTEEAKS